MQGKLLNEDYLFQKSCNKDYRTETSAEMKNHLNKLILGGTAWLNG